MKQSLILIYFILLFLCVSNLALAAKAPHTSKPAPHRNHLESIDKFLSAGETAVSNGSTLSDGATTLSPAAISLEQDLLTAVKSFERPLQLYHYFEAPLNPSSPKKINSYFDDKLNREQWISYFIGFRTGAFWDPNDHVTDLINAGPGMYLAIDPNASRDFGESTIIMTVPAGLKYLSILDVIPLRKQTRDLLVQENIISKNQLLGGATTLGLTRGFSGDAFKNMVREENSKFKNLINQIFSRNKILFIEYLYKSHLAGFCKSASQSAFVFVGNPPESTEPNADGEVLGLIPNEISKNVMVSDFDIQNLSEDEVHEKDIFTRFRNVLAGIREKGIGKASELIRNNLNDEEVNELADLSYQCERRY